MIATWDAETAAAMGRPRVMKDGGAVRVPLMLMDNAPTRAAMPDADAARADMLRHLGDAWRGETAPADAAPDTFADAETARAAWLAEMAGAWRP